MSVVVIKLKFVDDVVLEGDPVGVITIGSPLLSVVVTRAGCVDNAADPTGIDEVMMMDCPLASVVVISSVENEIGVLCAALTTGVDVVIVIGSPLTSVVVISSVENEVVLP
jgi:hypothetical protein